MLVLNVVELPKLVVTWYKSRNSHVFIAILSPVLRHGAQLTLTETTAFAETGHHTATLQLMGNELLAEVFS